MVKFSNDADILKYEPILFGFLDLLTQRLVIGSNGTVNGTTFTASGVNFVQSKVSPGGAIYLYFDSSFHGEFEIVSVDSKTQLTISVIRADSQNEPIPLPRSGAVSSYRISTLDPQACEAAFELTRYLGIQPGDPTSDIEVSDILDTTVLKQACVFSIISDVYARLAIEANSGDYWDTSRHYRQRFERARSGIRLAIDTDSDGITEQTNMSGSVRLIRD